ncbi:MAG: hypothetical protein KH295_01575 [Clostridiaceae bacterium]|nr:hypothetical protein [Clostridiaceae bacterium]
MTKRSVLIYLSWVLAAALITAFLMGWGAPSLLPFRAAEVERVELYHFVVPAAAERKTVTDPAQVGNVCHGLSAWAWPWPMENTYSGGATTSFRFYLKDGTTYDLIYSEPRTLYRTDSAQQCTLTDLGVVWRDCPAPSVPVAEDALPTISE